MSDESKNIEDLLRETEKLREQVKGLKDERSRRKNIEEALRQTNLLHSEAQRIAKLGHWKLDFKTGKLEWSDEIYRIFEIDKEKFRASYDAFLETIHPDDRDAVDKAYKDSVKNRTNYDIVHRLLFPDGRIKYVHEQCRTEYDDAGDPLFSIGIVNDITDLKVAEEAFKKTKQQMAFVLKATKTHLNIIDSEYNVLYVDEEWEKVYGPPGEKKCFEYFACREDPCPSCGVPEALEANRTVITEGIMPKEGRRPIMVVTSPFKDDDGKRYCAEVKIDITDRKKIESELIQAEKLSDIGRLSAGLVHELSSPLMGILNLLELNLRKTEPRENEKEEFEEMIKAATFMASILKDLKTFSRKSTGDLYEIKMDEVIESTLGFSNIRLSEKEIKIIRKYEPDLPAVMAEKNELQQVVLNMVNNACDAMREGGEFFISVYRSGDGDNVVAEFRDTGTGIREEDIPKLFTPFFTTKTPGRGVGLGLSVSHGIIRKYGGDISVESSPGKGTGFKISLPVAGKGEKNVKSEDTDNR